MSAAVGVGGSDMRRPRLVPGFPRDGTEVKGPRAGAEFEFHAEGSGDGFVLVSVLGGRSA